VLGRALGDPSLRVGYWIPRQGRFVGSDGQPVELPVGSARATATVLGNEDEPLAVLVHDPALLDDAGLVDAVAAAARLALENERLQAQIRLRVEDVIASRARIVAASDAERRRIERDLHDGAQQQLVSLALTLKLLELELGDQAVASTAPLIREAESEVLDAIDELRSLAHGIFPPVLGEEGLAAALEELADESPVAVTIADLPEGRLPAPVEAAAYFACRAAIASAVGARQLRIAATTTGDRLRLEIGDDGPDRRRPVESLEAVRDRVEALGGRLVVGGAGSSLVAEIPVGGTPLLPSRSPVPIA
jgi:signal transduction histidine kinase